MNLEQTKVAQLVKDASATIRKQASAITVLEEKLANAEAREAALLQRMEAEKLAAEMHDKGIRTEVPFDALVDRLEKEAAAGKLEAIKEAVSMTGPDMMKGAFINDQDSAGGGTTDFERYINGEVG